MPHKETLQQFTIGERLDRTLVTAFPQYSRSVLEKIIATDLVTVNGMVARSSYKTRFGDVIVVDLHMLRQPVPDISLTVLYEDADIIVIDKPSGVLTHAKGTLHNEATVATFIKSRLNDSSDWRATNRAGIVHRLDRATSGLIVCAKNQITQTFLQKQFADRKIKKLYIAAIAGTLEAPEGMIDIPIERNPKKPSTFRAGPNGKSAQTHFKTVDVQEKCSLVELRPITGRTHQLRVHLQYLGHPIIGDTVYGGAPYGRLCLHAASIELTLPSKERKVFTSNLPREIKDAWKAL
ncbi:MAG TPA: RluA family pseudouridine synthase [Candidatus Saccharibacteria bacterium]|nr:RluA family pseudouridine synthase [Candidatus Saccharibacteria bacterium]